MMKLISLAFYLIKELIFASKDEWNIKSNKFNGKKVAAAIVLFMSLLMNIFFLNRLYTLAVSYTEMDDKLSACVKNQEEGPSDSAKTSNIILIP